MKGMNNITDMLSVGHLNYFQLIIFSNKQVY
jgi:hypothetical protein